MEITNEVEVLEEDIEEVKAKCNKIQCNPIYDAVIKLFKYFFKCITKRENI